MENETMEQLKERLNSSSKYLQSNDMRVIDVHGGALFSLGDTAAGAASFATGRDSVTLSASINYIKPGIGGKLIAIAQEISRGRTTGVYEIFIFNDKEVLLCRATFTMFFLDQDRYHKKKQDAPKAEG